MFEPCWPGDEWDVAGDPVDELSSKTTFKGHTLWARFEARIHELVEWLANRRSGTATPFEALSK